MRPRPPRPLATRHACGPDAADTICQGSTTRSNSIRIGPSMRLCACPYCVAWCLAGYAGLREKASKLNRVPPRCRTATPSNRNAAGGTSSMISLTADSPSSQGCSRWSLRSCASASLSKSKRPDQSASRPARPPPAALITGEESKLRSFIGLPPLKPGTIRCDVMLVTRNSLHTTVSRSTGLTPDRSGRERGQRPHII